jgi:hypothetical protein
MYVVTTLLFPLFSVHARVMTKYMYIQKATVQLQAQFYPGFNFTASAVLPRKKNSNVIGLGKRISQPGGGPIKWLPTSRDSNTVLFGVKNQLHGENINMVLLACDGYSMPSP